MKDARIYLEAFAIIDGQRINLKVIDLVDACTILTGKIIEGVEKVVAENE